MYEECPHGRHKGAYCEPCAENAFARWVAITQLGTAEFTPSESVPGAEHYKDPRDNPLFFSYPVDSIDTSQKPVEKQEQSGLNAEYYDFPPNCKSTMDLVEWLEEGGMSIAEFNILKSIIRSNNPNAKKKTTRLYEAEKQYYYSERRLRALQKNEASGG